MTKQILDYAAPSRTRMAAWKVALLGAIVGKVASVGVFAFEEFSSYGSYLPGCVVGGPLLLMILVSGIRGVAEWVAILAGVPLMYALYALIIRMRPLMVVLVAATHLAGSILAYLWLA
jgi:hypothetical protein